MLSCKSIGWKFFDGRRSAIVSLVRSRFGLARLQQFASLPFRREIGFCVTGVCPNVRKQSRHTDAKKIRSRDGGEKNYLISNHAFAPPCHSLSRTNGSLCNWRFWLTINDVLYNNITNIHVYMFIYIYLKALYVARFALFVSLDVTRCSLLLIQQLPFDYARIFHRTIYRNTDKILNKAIICPFDYKMTHERGKFPSTNVISRCTFVDFYTTRLTSIFYPRWIWTSRVSQIKYYNMCNILEKYIYSSRNFYHAVTLSSRPCTCWSNYLANISNTISAYDRQYLRDCTLELYVSLDSRCILPSQFIARGL